MEVSMFTKSLTKTVAAVLALMALPAVANAETFSFVAIGDMPYGEPDKVYATYEALIGEINKRAPAFTVHIGDTKSGSTQCSDEMLNQQLAFMNSFAAALVYTPGDNEWTDCHREKAGRFDPLERLAYIRANYFKDAKSLGAAPIAVERQADVMPDFKDYVENARFEKAGIQFVTAHVVGSNNNFEIRDEKAAMEFFARDKANVAWLKDSFKKATDANAKALVLAIQADMFEFDWNAFKDETFLRHSGYQRFGDAFIKEAAAFAKPVLLIFGDSHIHRVFRPFEKSAPNVVALEVYGDKDMHAVEVMVDSDSPAVFGFRTLANPAQPFKAAEK
jgi:hypothetical protein